MAAEHLEIVPLAFDLAVDRVGYGTDFTQGHDRDFFGWISHDKCYACRPTDLGTLKNTAALTAAM
jgi:hypothetical protein